ncbi:MAG: imidazolonepropionase [Rhodobacteraceae bacterium]|nr:imidazolonepropionase [Paracoccaceae bacterium]
MVQVYRNCSLATMRENHGPYGLIDDAMLAVSGSRISWVGSAESIPDSVEGDVELWIDLDGATVTPALIDCHTHLVFGGNRALEFEDRLRGIDYSQASRNKGGIVATVAATRRLSEDELLDQALPRARRLLQDGATLVEIKSGYGLDIDTELKMLKVARRLPEHCGIEVATTWLAAHALPPEYRGQARRYLDEVAIAGLVKANELGLVDAVDAFCEGIAFSADELRPVFVKAAQLNLPLKIHAEQLSHCGGTALAAEFGALSADHLEYCRASDAEALAESGAVAVLLPGAFYTLGQYRKPPIQLFREFGVPIAIATDCNPGSSPLTSPLLAMNMACMLFGMTPQEALEGMTRNAARAIGRKQDLGTLAAGKRADFAVWDIDHPRELSYRMGFSPLRSLYRSGKNVL